MESWGVLDNFNERIIASDGGPSHFKVYKTQYWMSKHCSKQFSEKGIRTEWNMYFANLGHNICDSHAGHLKRQVKKAEGNFVHLSSVNDIVNCVDAVRNTTKHIFTADEINSHDIEKTKAVGGAFIKKYHHFSYPESGVVRCSYMKGEEGVVRRIRQENGTLISIFLFCFYS